MASVDCSLFVLIGSSPIPLLQEQISAFLKELKNTRAALRPDKFINYFIEAGVSAFAFDYDQTITTGRYVKLTPPLPKGIKGSKAEWTTVDVITGSFKKVAVRLQDRRLPLYVVTMRELGEIDDDAEAQCAMSEAWVRYVLEANKIRPTKVFAANPE